MNINEKTTFQVGKHLLESATSVDSKYHSNDPKWWSAIVVALLVSGVLLLQPVFLNLFVPQVDQLTHIRWVTQFYASLQDGVIFPRWAFASHLGLGDPTFLYYSPLFYYVASAATWLLNDPESGVRLTLMFSNTLLGVVSYSVLARFNKHTYALLGMAFGQAIPILFFLSSYYAAWPWVFAAPFVVGFVADSAKSQQKPVRLGLWLAMCVASHVLSGLMVLLMVGTVQLARATWRNSRLLGSWLFGVALGLSLAAFYLWPALMLQTYINPKGWTTDPALDWRRAFAFPITTYFQYGFRWFAMQYPFPVVTLLMSGATWWVSRDLKPAVRSYVNTLVAFSLAALLLSSEFAYPLYALLTPLQTLQWPYRFVVPAMLSASLGLMIALGTRAFSDSKCIATYGAYCVLAMVLSLNGLLQVGLAREGVHPPTARTVMQGQFGQPEFFTAQRQPGWKGYIADGNWIGECQKAEALCLNEKRRTHIWTSTFESDREVKVRLPLFYFPAWELLVDGVMTAASADTDSGLLQASLLAGKHVITVRWKTMESERLGRAISISTLLAMLFFALVMPNVARRK